MSVHASSQPRRRMARKVVLFAITVLLLAAVGASYEAVMSARDDRRFPPPGKLVDVGRFRLHIHCTGLRKVGTLSIWISRKLLWRQFGAL